VIYAANVPAVLPAAPTHNPLKRLVGDLRRQATTRGHPPGPTSPSVARTLQMSSDPLPILLDAYERFGPVFTVRILHLPEIFVLGPEANHYVTVSHAANFLWRDGGFGELEPLLGDGLLTIDGPYHRRTRKMMLPAFHRDRIAEATVLMVDEIERALDAWRPGEVIDLYTWARGLAMRIAMLALLGLDPDHGGAGARAARAFERALSFYGTDFHLRLLRGPGSPWQRMLRARRELDSIVYAEIGRRRRSGEERRDMLGMLLEATDEDGTPLSDREVRDQAITLLFAGHDTTTSTISFLVHELMRNPVERERLETELGEVLGDRAPTAADLSGGLPRLEMVLDETLRLYPPAWIGPRRAVEAFELCGARVPAGASVNYSSWASHRLPDVWEEPEAFRPDRFAPEAKAALPKGAYVPFGGGSRTCIGMRFGQMEVKAMAALITRRWRLQRVGGPGLSIRQMPTLSPEHGLEVRVLPR
jgi:cytochrome P450